jgi:enoyl-CoA hydratase
VAAGIATHRAPSARFGELAAALCGTEPMDDVLAGFASPALQEAAPYGKSAPALPGSVTAHRGAIDRLFAAESVEDILARLDAEAAAGGDSASDSASWAGAVAAAIRAKAPLSLKIALAQMQRGRHWTFSDCMQAEFRIVSRVVYGHDFYEGIRAVIIDKDNRPQWRPDTLAAVTADAVDAHFAPISSELMLP